MLVILIFLAAAIISEWHRLSHVRNEIVDLATRTSPLLSETNDLARISSALRTLSETTRAASDLAALESIRKKLETLFRDAARLPDRGAFPLELQSRTYTTFDTLLTAQSSMISAGERIARMNLRSLEALDRFSRDLQSDHHPHLLDFLIEPRSSSLDTERQRHLDDLLTISEIKVSLARLSVLTSGLGVSAVPRADAARAQVIREVGVLATRVARLQSVSLKRALAGHLAQYRDAMIGPDGVIHAVNRLSQETQKRDAAFLDAAQLVDQVTKTLGQTSLQAASRFERTALATEQTVKALLRQKMILTLILVLLVSVFAWSVVERGLISRLARLTAHVRRLAQGDYSTPIGRTGHDEVGEIEEAVERSRLTSAALRRSNEELERFAYAAAHDLRSPLRAVSDLVDWTQEDFGSDLPQGARDNLALIAGRVSRLSNHLAALLQYARAGQTETKLGSFDLAAFARQLRQDFFAEEGVDITVEAPDGPFLTCPTPVKTILLNLVGNAIKHHDRDRRLIELSAREEAHQIVLSVADDGPGIAPDHHARIFQLFQTLGTGEDSTGMGLALVQKLTLSLGGSVTVASDPAVARGTVFTVRLPKVIAADALRPTDEDCVERRAA